MYVALPAAALLITLALAAVFFGRLTQEIAYLFLDNVPVRWIDRGIFLAWVLGLQSVFVLLSGALILLIILASRKIPLPETKLLRTLLTIIGNVVALPQFIIAYAMTGIFLYNIYEITLPPLQIIAVAVMIMGGIVLVVFFARAIAQARKIKTGNKPGSGSDVRK
jgi:hypothetical protein